MPNSRSDAEVTQATAKFWLGLRPSGAAETILWGLHLLVGAGRILISALIRAGACLALLTVGLGLNAALSGAIALAAAAARLGPFEQMFSLAMTICLFLSLVSIVRAGGPDITAIVLGVVPRRNQHKFRATVVARVQSLADAALAKSDDYQAAAKFWFAKPAAFTELVSYICVCIVLLSLFMTFATTYLSAAALTGTTLIGPFLYYLQLGADGSFFNLLDLAGIELSEARPAESFPLRLIRFAIYTIYLGRVVGYAMDIAKIDLDKPRAALFARIYPQGVTLSPGDRASPTSE